MEYHIPRKFRRTEIVVTLGPAADHDNNLEKVITAGANIVCMNFSRGSLEDRRVRANKIREIATRLGHHMAILSGLQGSKIRTSTFKEGRVPLNIRDEFLLSANLGRGEGDKGKVDISYRGLPVGVVPGDIPLLDDGCVQSEILKVQDMKVLTEVTVSGPLSNNKGIGKLGGGLSAEAPTEEGETDIKTAALVGVDYLAVSSPRRGGDLSHTHHLARGTECGAGIVTKVKHAEVVYSQDTVDDIISTSDVAVVAHGNLGVEIDDPELVGIQGALIRRVYQLDRAIITVTQVMESVITNPMPTRAEIMDVANAVLNGTDAMMLSAETTTGQYPSEIVVAIARVCLGAEKIPNVSVSKHRLDVQFDNMEKAIAMLVTYTVNHLKGAMTIITVTESDRTTLTTSRINSGPPVFAMSRHERMLNLTALYRGVASMHFDNTSNDIAAVSETIDLLRDKGYLTSGDLATVTQSDAMGTVGSTSATCILTVE